MEYQNYEPSGLALDIFRQRYAIHPNESFSEACERVAHHVAVAEQGEKQAAVRAQFVDVLKKNLFFPGGRIMFGSGRPKGQLLNCFVVPTHDSREGWGKTTSDTIIISGVGGGVGTNYSPIRPRNSLINGSGGKASGAVSLMRGINAFGEEMKNGGGRRVALMMTLRIDHGDIEEFLDAKLDLKKLNNANVSVNFEEDPEIFFDYVKKDLSYDLKHNGKVVGKIPAKKIWRKIVVNALKGGEPGLLNGYLANRMNNVWYYAPLISTNPCITGDSKIAVADGRNAVSIQQLADEGRDVPVYSTNVETGQVEIKMGRNPRRTGEQKEIWKLTLDDGSTLRATPDHRIMRKDRTYVELKDLKPGDSVFPFNSFNSNGYRQVCNTGAKMIGGARRQYRLIHEFFNGPVDASANAIHHDNYDSTDDRIENLRVLTHEQHRRLHAERMTGEQNPYHQMDVAWRTKFASHQGKDNGRYSGHTNEQLLDEGKRLFDLHGKLTQEIWAENAKQTGLPQFLGNEFHFGSFSNFKNQVATNHRVVSVEFCGHEDVYNITVDDNHNYHVITNQNDDGAVISSGICVKNCGEIWLCEYDCCCLGSVVLPRFVDETTKEFDWDELKRTVVVGVRFLDDVLSVNTYPIPEIKGQCSNLRRIGLGVTGLHDMLLKMGLKYNSSAGLEFVDRVWEKIKHWSYEASTDLAEEKGAFPKFDPEKFVKSGFCKSLKPSLRERIKTKGMRNCAVNTVAPVGTGSMVCDSSSGIEPMFASAYRRKYRKDDELAEEIVIHPLFKKFMDEGLSVKHFQGAHELKVKDHFEMQRVVQRHVDNAVSKTINLPAGISEDELSDLYMEYFPELKGVTIYPDGSREDQPLTPMDLEHAIAAYEANAQSGAAGNDNCKSGVCDL